MITAAGRKSFKLAPPVPLPPCSTPIHTTPPSHLAS